MSNRLVKAWRTYTPLAIVLWILAATVGAVCVFNALARGSLWLTLGTLAASFVAALIAQVLPIDWVVRK